MTKIEEIVAYTKNRKKTIDEFRKKVKQVSNIEPNDLKLGEYIITSKEKIPFSLNGIYTSDCVGVYISDYVDNYDMFKYSYTINDLNLKKPIRKILITKFEDLGEIEKAILKVELKNLWLE